MQKSVNPWLAATIVIFFGGLLGGYLWAGSQWMQLPRLGLAKVSSQGELVFQFGSRLEFVSAQGQLTQELDAAQLGQKNFVGDFDFLGSGELLLALQQNEISTPEKLRIFARAEHPSEAIGDEQTAGLYACKLQPLSCRRFSRELAPLNDSFRLFVDAQDQVYLADTVRHQIIWLDAEGKRQAEAKGFAYPNQIMVQGESLIVADTNHHAIKKMAANKQHFASLEQEIAVKLGSAAGYTWPVNVQLAANYYWVLVADNNLSYAKLARYSLDGQFVDELPLPEGADAISLVEFNNRMLVLDMAKFAIYQFADNGQRLADFTPAGLQREWSALDNKSAHYLRLQANCLRVFAIAAVLGLAIAVVLAGREHKLQQQALAQQCQSDQPVHQDIWLEPSGPAAKSIRSLPWILLVSGAVFIALAVSPLLQQENQPVALLTGTLLVILILGASIIAWIWQRKILGQRLGILQNKLVLVLADKSKIEDSYANIFWSDQGLMLKNKRVAINFSVKKGLFDTGLVQQHLLPRLFKANKISAWALIVRQLSVDGYARLSLGAMLLLLLAYLMTNLLGLH